MGAIKRVGRVTGCLPANRQVSIRVDGSGFVRESVLGFVAKGDYRAVHFIRDIEVDGQPVEQVERGHVCQVVIASGVLPPHGAHVSLINT